MLQVEDLIYALSMSPEKVKLLSEIPSEWMLDSGESLPVILVESATENMNSIQECPTSHAILWGIQHESDAIKCLESIKKVQVEQCGIYISHQLPFLGATPKMVVST